MTEKDILFSVGNFWVCKIKGAYHTMKSGITHSETVCAFDDLSLAIAYAKYKHNPRYRYEEKEVKS